MTKIAHNSLIVTAFNVGGIALAFFSSVVIAWKFGAGRAMDIYFAAITLPFFIITILSLTLSFTFIPMFTEYENIGKKDIWKIVSSFINICLILTAVICAAGIIFSRNIITVIIPGFDAAKVNEAASLMSLLFPAVILCVLNELFASIYYAHNRFAMPSLIKILTPAATIIFMLAFGSRIGTTSLVLATVGAYLIQDLLLAAGFMKNKDFAYTLNVDFKNPEVIKIFKLMAPLIAAMLITKTFPLVDRFFLSHLEEGCISYVSYAQRFTLRMIDGVSTGLILALFPLISSHAALSEHDKMYYYMTKSIKMLFFMIIPVVVIFFIYGKPAIKFLFERGMFTAYDTEATFKAFSMYLLSLPAIVIVAVLTRACYALKRNSLVAVISVLITFLYVLLCYLLIRFFGYLAIPLSSVIVFNANILIYGLVIKRIMKIDRSYGLAPELAKNIASAAMAVLCLAPVMIFGRDEPIAYFAAVTLGFVIYFVLSKYLFRLEASEIVWEQMMVYKRRIWR